MQPIYNWLICNNIKFAHLSKKTGWRLKFCASKCKNIFINTDFQQLAKAIFMLWEQGVEGSNPFTPTTENQGVTKNVAPFLVAVLYIFIPILLGFYGYL